MNDVINRLQKRVAREKKARQEAESLLEAKASDLHEANENLRKLLHFQEVLVKERTEELRQALQLANDASQHKSLFLANMSHEIRTPMNAVIGLAHLALETNLNSQQRDYLNKIQGSAQHLLGIINDILDFSKVESGQLSIERKAFNLDELLEQIYNLNHLRAEQKQLRLAFQRDFSLPDGYMGDALRLQQILTNLVNNAVKFTHEGRVSLNVEAVESEDEVCRLRFVIADTGIGMSEEQLARLFKPFTQADSSTTRHFGGTGLGLAICKQLAELMNGTIKVRSEPECGTEFEVVVPLTARYCSIEPSNLGMNVHGLRLLAIGLDSKVGATLHKYGIEILDLAQVTASPEPIDGVLIGCDSDQGQIPWDVITQCGHSEDASSIPVMQLDPNVSGLHDLPSSFRLECPPNLLTPNSFIQRLGEVTGRFSVESVMQQQTELLDGVELLSDKPLQGLRILVVEDNLINLEIVQTMLEKLGASLRTEQNGRAAVDWLSNHSVDMVLMDIQMPIMDGYEATLAIRQFERHQQTPIIALTANAFDEDQTQCLDVGMNGHLSKPIDHAQLIQTILHWTSGVSNSFLDSSKKPASDTAKGASSHLAVLDFHDGLQRASNNEVLYLSLLRRFVENNDDLTLRLNAYLEMDAFDEYQAAVHNLKGVAATLGAKQMSQLGAAMEAAAQGDRETSKDLVRQFDASFQSFVDQFEDIETQLMESIAAREEPTPDDDEVDLTELLDQLDGLLQEADTTALDMLPAIQSAAQKELADQDRAQIQTLCQFINDFEFEKAAELFKEIREALAADSI